MISIEYLMRHNAFNFPESEKPSHKFCGKTILELINFKKDKQKRERNAKRDQYSPWADACDMENCDARLRVRVAMLESCLSRDWLFVETLLRCEFLLLLPPLPPPPPFDPLDECKCMVFRYLSSTCCKNKKSGMEWEKQKWMSTHGFLPFVMPICSHAFIYERKHIVPDISKPNWTLWSCHNVLQSTHAILLFYHLLPNSSVPAENHNKIQWNHP